jgi:hypothetical protein
MALVESVDRLLADTAAQGMAREAPVRAVLVPHAAHRYSGAVAAAAFREVRGQTVRRVVVLAPAHRARVEGLALPRENAFATPLGAVPVDREAVEAIGADPLARGDPGAHDAEHAIEVQLPFLQRALPRGWTLVPVLVGSLAPGDEARAAALLAPLLDTGTLLVISGDFTHFGERFGYQPFPLDGSTRDRIAALDEGAYARIAARDPAGLAAYRARTGITACAVDPARVLAALLPPEARAERVAYGMSGDQTGDYRHSVSYLAATFRWPGEAGPQGVGAEAELDALDGPSLGYLRQLARAAVEASVVPLGPAGERLTGLLARVPPALERPGGAFVTLRSGGELRGCVGTLPSTDPLYAVVARCAVGAARHDPRFPPVAAAELAGLSVEVSVLAEPRPIDSWRAIRVGEDGIVLSHNGRRAVFLPEVAREQGWGPEETLTALSRKAGLDADAWRNGARLAVFTTQRASEPADPGD